MNTYAYVENNPVSQFDPYGLWSINIAFYRGWGGQITFGSANGKGFVYGGLGWGIQGGVSFDPNGDFPRPSGIDAGQCSNESEWFFAPTGQIGAQIGPINVEASGSAGGYYNPVSGYSFFESSSSGVTYTKFGLGIGASVSPIYGGIAFP